MPLFIANLWNWKRSSKKIPQKQLLYELSQTVFEYMDPSSRFHLSLHLPPLRSIEKGTPLEINELIFHDNTIFIDRAKYELSIGRMYKRQKPPLRINKAVDFDVDEFGWATSTEDIMMNRDVYMESYSSSTDGTERLRLEDAELKRKEQHKCKFTLKLTIESKYGEIRKYKSSKITKIYKGMKMLIGAIFGNRTVMWNVESMDICTDNLRWIVSGEKPLVRNVRLTCHRFVNLDSLRSICHPTSFPLKSLNFEMDPRILDHEILVNAEKLIVSVGFGPSQISFMDQFMEISHLNVQLFQTPPTLFAYFMNLWLDHGRPVGTSWSFPNDELEPSKHIDILRENAQVIESDRRSVKLSMGPSSILSVSYGDPKPHDNGISILNVWTVKMEVLRRSDDGE